MPDKAGRKFLIETFGCELNYHDGERITGLLESEGYEATTDEDAAELLVLNTCSIREKAVDKVKSRLGEILDGIRDRGGKEPMVAVTGCVAQQEGDKLFAHGAPIDVVAGTQAIKQLPRLLEEARATKKPRFDINPYEDVSFPLGMARDSDPARALITIIEGCNEFCAFCVVPYTRGHERMRPVRDILAEVQRAADTGHIEVHLLGQIVNHYQAPDEDCDFGELLRRVHDVAGIERIRFSSPHPRHVSQSLIDAIRDLPKLAKHLHLPVQSGSNRVLKEMRRRYTREMFLEQVVALRQAVPSIALSTDMIIGFPTETAEDFEQSMDLVRQARFHAMYSFKYSPRPNTLAVKRMPDDVPEGEKTRRIVALQDLQRDIQGEVYAAMVGQIEPVLVDARSRRRDWELAGRTSGNTIVNFPGDASLVGQIVPVRITAAAPNSLRGEAVHAH